MEKGRSVSQAGWAPPPYRSTVGAAVRKAVWHRCKGRDNESLGVCNTLLCAPAFWLLRGAASRRNVPLPVSIYLVQ